MRRKNLIVKRKVKKVIIRDKKIQKIYLQFKKIIFKNIKKNNFAIAVSGGSDSLCLAYFSSLYSKEFKNKIHVLIVDHKLRKESYSEAILVKKILKKKNIRSKLLRWHGKTPESNIQSKARIIRYSLIHNYCKENNIKYLLTAHHMDDQIENFFIRLFRGSGITGLASMSESFNYSKSLKIIRPFLILKKNDLRHVTVKYFKTYIQDPSNENEKYLRVRIRKYRSSMEKEGLDTNKIIKTVNNLLSANKALIFYKNKALKKYASFLSKDKCLIDKQIFTEEAGEIIFKFFSDIFSLISGKYYPPRSKKIINLINRTKKINFEKCTLGGCVVEKRDSFILVSRETKAKRTAYQLHK
tara:strand:- start:576 stop:1640 length:1065 start_codon:yes stop_codon:yes gene_type:complete